MFNRKDHCSNIPNPIGRQACETQTQAQTQQWQRQVERQEQWNPRYTQPAERSNPPAYGWQEVDKNIEKTLKENWFAWVNRVREDGTWDYKKKQKDHSWSKRERAGNINYGATCVAAGHDPETCLRAGGAFQGLTDAKNLRVPFSDSSGRPWDMKKPTSCFGEPIDDCQQVIQGMRYGSDYLRRRGR
ncbi:hypothetical protein Mmc1_3399 [Magnetococcus marinus MC-1]|uniref:Bacterial toxin 44 domain-containing protein n=1 Tax=Magnetococcus marinus (strain ATCC BAA-1437 / JCM 17883 / MC-1) TaxID=156889 RepID=A0LD42_MAGMM|nr:polymorphic toxin type 44 domain-containing protein [Magnetococcus marinus]ABK45885.1 hypothetical protein Mmc1_3399 [Magnetococcus marinus MC-1]